MSVKNTSIEEAFEIIENHPDADFFDSIPLDKVKEAELTLGIKFPKSYTQFLQKYGAGSVLATEIYGITKNNGECVPNGIWCTQNARTKAGLPSQFVIIGDAGYGPYYVLDTSQMNENQECPVYMWDVGGLREKVADSFGDFLFDELKGIRSLE